MKLAIVRQTYTPYGGAERFVERALAAQYEQDVRKLALAVPSAFGSGRPSLPR